jgi:hypothetical protein
VATDELIGLKGSFGVGRVAKDFSAGFNCAGSASFDTTAPIQQFKHIVNGGNAVNALPLLHFALHHCQEGRHELPLPLRSPTQPHSARLCENVLVDPYSHRPTFHEDHPHGRPEEPVNCTQSNEALEDLE